MKKIRKGIDAMGMRLPLPNVHPNTMSGLSVIASMLFLLLTGVSTAIALIFLTAALILDWFDGIIARKFGKTSEEGYIVDVASDRFSEGLMFTAFFYPWFYLFTLNCILAILSVKRKRHFILPLRHVFLVFYVLLLF